MIRLFKGNRGFEYEDYVNPGEAIWPEPFRDINRIIVIRVEQIDSPCNRFKCHYNLNGYHAVDIDTWTVVKTNQMSFSVSYKVGCRIAIFRGSGINR